MFAILYPQAGARRARGGKHTPCLANQAVNLNVSPALIVMGKDQLAYTGFGGQTSTGGPSAVAPAALCGIFGRRILRVGNQYICPTAKIRQSTVGVIGVKFMIGGEDVGASVDSNAVGDALLGMPERMPGDLGAV